MLISSVVNERMSSGISSQDSSGWTSGVVSIAAASWGLADDDDEGAASSGFFSDGVEGSLGGCAEDIIVEVLY